MTPSKWFLSFAILGLLLLGAALWLRERPAPVPAAAVAPAPAAAASAATAFPTAKPLQRVVDLYERESARVGRVDPDPEGTKRRLEQAAANLEPAEISWLESQALDPKTEMDARFFAVYLLGLSHQEAAVQSLAHVALSPVPVSKNERGTEENRALRGSAVEGMCTPENCKIPASRERLMQVVGEQSDEWLRDRANRCLYACQYGKRVEDADKEAIEKLRSGRRK